MPVRPEDAPRRYADICHHNLTRWGVWDPSCGPKVRLCTSYLPSDRSAIRDHDTGMDTNTNMTWTGWLVRVHQRQHGRSRRRGQHLRSRVPELRRRMRWDQTR